MNRPRLHRRLCAVALLATSSLALSTAPALAQTATPIAAPGSASTADSGPSCARPLLDEPQRAAVVKNDSASTFASAAARNNETSTDFAKMAKDRSLWLDECGQSFFVEAANPDAAAGPVQASSAPEQGTTVTQIDNPAGDLPAGVNPLTLESRPGSPRTIYLDFDGERVTDTAWNDADNPEIIAEPYSITAPADTNFSAAEQAAIYRAWLVVSEDYAPFDVNVTTQDPGAAALDRTDASDQVFGTRAVITSGGARKVACGCAGVAYLDVFSVPGPNHAPYQPAWIYTDGSGTDGWDIGQAASHEVGHNFGLAHDGRTTASGTEAYYLGTNSWAPIMGASYYSVLGQWSKGSYAGATNTEDDLAIIANGAPLLGDDHGDTPATGTPIDVYAPVTGLINSRTDKDAFTFTASGRTRFTVVAATPDTNLDATLTILDSSGQVLDATNPEIYDDEPAHPLPYGLSATWETYLPETPETYTVVVDGGDNEGRIAGQPYDDYDSLGRYQVALDTTAPSDGTQPLTATSNASLAITAGEANDLQPVTATGGTAPYTFSTTELPVGLSIDALNGRITGVVDPDLGYLGAWYVTVTVRDARGVSRSIDLELMVTPAERISFGGASYYRTAGQPFSEQLSVNGARTEPTWTVVDGTVPSGLTLSSSGLLSGTPTAAGSSRFTVQARTSNSLVTGPVVVEVAAAPAPPVSQPPTPTLPTPTLPTPTLPTPTLPTAPLPPPTPLPPVLPIPTLAIDTAAIGSATVSDPYSVSFAARGVTTTTAWRVLSGALPTGLILTRASDSVAVLRGIPTKAGTFRFRVQVLSADGRVAVHDYVLTVSASVAFSTRTLPAGKFKRAYTATITLANPTRGLTWTRAAGALPAGLKMTPSTDRSKARLTGKPTRKGTFRFTLRVRETDGDSITRSFAIKVS